LGGKGLNCEVEMLDAATMAVKNGDSRIVAGRGLESRFHLRHESEANLLGVVFTEAGAMTGAPYRVADAKHWILAGTGLHAGDNFGTHSLHRRCPGGASGHETDKISPSSPKNVRLLAKGLNVDDGGAHMVTFDTPSGGSVFSTGSICWVSALLVDEAVSKITANVIRKFAREG
ncbi:MAG: N,N-dimethylformamidase beta subunit family domain-containing protein, partial [Gemmataceae bacterium]